MTDNMGTSLGSLHIPDLIVKLCVFVPFINEFFPYDGQYGNESRIFTHSRLDCKIMCIRTFYIRVISLTTGKMVPGLGKSNGTTNLSLIFS